MKESEDRVGRFDVHLIRKIELKKATLDEWLKLYQNL